MRDKESAVLGSRENQHSLVRGSGKVALVTPCLSHLPFHPSCLLGYGTAVLAGRHDVEVIDLNAELHFRSRAKLKPLLDLMDKTQVVSDIFNLHLFYLGVDTHIDRHYGEIRWNNYSSVYITPPTWFPTIPAEVVLRLTRIIKRLSPECEIFFFGNSLATWTNEEELKKNGIRVVHLNDLFAIDAAAKPVQYDLLPTPVYEHRDKYLFDLLPFMLKHGCPWGRCRFCSLSKGWNSGYAERSAVAVITELEALIAQYDPAALVCRDHSLNGHNLVEFCGLFERFHKPWCGMSRPDLSEKKIEALRKAGCRGIFFGLESGSDRMLSVMNKGITTRQLSEFIIRLHSNEILPAPSLIIGTPGEEREDFEKTIQFLVDHSRYVDVVNVYPFLATPASAFGSQEMQPHKDTQLRLQRFVQTCEELELKVCLGEQSIEYFLFNWIITRGLAGS